MVFRHPPAMTDDNSTSDPYRLDAQVGFLLRKANQRHLAVFNSLLPDLTPTQFAVLAKLYQNGAMSQNALGRETAMDAATIKGVVERLVRRELLVTRRDEQDRRRTNIDLSEKGRQTFLASEPIAREITQKTLQPLAAEEQRLLLKLIEKIS